MIICWRITPIKSSEAKNIKKIYKLLNKRAIHFMIAYDLFNFYQNSFKQLYLTRIVNGSNPPRHTLYIQAAELCNYSIYFFTQFSLK